MKPPLGLNVMAQNNLNRGTAIEFIDAHRSEAKRITEVSLEDMGYQYFRCLKLDLATLGELYFLLSGQPFSEDYLQEFVVLARSANNRTLVIELPQTLVQALAVFDGPQSTLAAQWREKSGIILNGWHYEYRINVLRSLIGLAQRVHAKNSGILLRVKV